MVKVRIIVENSIHLTLPMIPGTIRTLRLAIPIMKLLTRIVYLIGQASSVVTNDRGSCPITKHVISGQFP